MIDQAMIERVAPAIYGVTPERLRGGEQAIRWEHIHPLARERHPVQARAALIAMRNPTAQRGALPTAERCSRIFCIILSTRPSKNDNG
jgi:hypothetical protein